MRSKLFAQDGFCAEQNVQSDPKYAPARKATKPYTSYAYGLNWNLDRRSIYEKLFVYYF